MYRLVFGRAPTADEVTAGRDFLQGRGVEAVRGAAHGRGEGRETRPATAKTGAEPTPPAETSAGEDGDADRPDGMMAGVAPGAKRGRRREEKMLPVTTFGRYVKILLSSNEFLFVS